MAEIPKGATGGKVLDISVTLLDHFCKIVWTAGHALRECMKTGQYLEGPGMVMLMYQYLYHLYVFRRTLSERSTRYLETVACIGSDDDSGIGELEL